MKTVKLLANQFQRTAKAASASLRLPTELQNRLRVITAKEKSTSSSDENVRDRRSKSKSRGSTSIDSKRGSECKPYSSLPGPKGLPFFGTLPEVSKMLDKIHIFKNERCKKYGPIWKEPLPHLGDLVVIASAKGAHDIEKIDGTKQRRLYPPALEDYYKRSGRSPGISQKCGELWKRDRRALEKILMNPPEEERAKDRPKMQAVAKDFIDRLDRIRCPEGNVKNIDKELLKYVVESCCVILFNCRLGSLQDNPSVTSTTLINAVRHSCKLSGGVFIHPPIIARTFYNKQWTECTDCLDTIYEVAVKNVDKLRRSEIAEPSDSLIGRIHEMGILTTDELYSCANDLLINTITTTPNVLHFACYELARRSDIQQKALNDISLEIPIGKEVTCQNLENLHFLRAFMKEVLRLYPVEHTGAARVLERDEIINGYQVPKGKNVMLDPYLIGRSSDLYDEPNAFIPERWLKDGRISKEMEPLSWIPFGIGDRCCVGKRFAMIQTQLCLLELIRNYKMSTNTKEMRISSHACLEPIKPIHLKLSHRLK